MVDKVNLGLDAARRVLQATRNNVTEKKKSH